MQKTLTVVASRRNDHRGIDSVGIHARLVIVMHRNQSPVGDDASNLNPTGCRLPGDQILHSRGVEQLYVREAQHFAEQRAREKRGVLDDHEARARAVILVRHTELAQESIGRLAHDHGAEKLATEPSSTTRGNTCLDNGDFQVRASLGENVGGGETTAARTDDHDVALGVFVQIGKVAPGHAAGDLALADRSEAEVGPVAGHGLDGGGRGAILGDRDGRGVRNRSHFDGVTVGVAVGRLVAIDQGGWRSHGGGCDARFR